jgi:hypothetical protein
MQYIGRVVGAAALALSTTALYGCYAPPPPPVAVVTPDQTLPPPLTPYNSNYATAQYGSTAPVAAAPSNAGTAVIVAPYAPPPLRVETAPPAPSALAMWQPGHWGWNETQYAWVAGHYVERPSPSANWTPGYWQQGPAGWTWADGYWS